MHFECEENIAVANFRNYLRIPSVQPDVNYEQCVEFLSKLGEDIGLSVNVIESHPKKPVVVMTLNGSNPELPSIMLNSHMDVVPADPTLWHNDPFEAFKDDQGNIYGRGAQDIKSLGIQQMEAVRRIKEEGLQLKRTIHITYTPDEEIVSKFGMAKFVRSDFFKRMNVGVWLDEARPNSGDEFLMYYAERITNQVEIVFTGESGHGSTLPNDTAAEKLNYMMAKMSEFRQKEKQRLESDTNLALGEVTTINLTRLQGGTQTNVIPTELRAFFDIRITPLADVEKFNEMIKRWANEAGTGVQLHFEKIRTNADKFVTKLNSDNLWWMALKDEYDKMNLKLKPIISPGSTDGDYGRAIGIPVFGLSTINRSPVLIHDHNEFLNEKIFLKGIDILYNVVKRFASL